jgi:hypothetical protein
VLAADHDSFGARKGQVVTDKYPRAGHKTGREALVVTVSDTNDPGEVRDGSAWETDVDHSKIARAVMGEAVR